MLATPAPTAQRALAPIDRAARQVRPRTTQPRAYDVVPVATSQDQIFESLLEIIRDHHGQVARFAEQFRRPSIAESIELLFAFQRKYIRYHEDGHLYQHLKEPARILADRQGDCKSYTILTVSVLMALGIESRVRFVSYDGSQFSHVYAMARTPEGWVAVDPCLPHLGQERPYAFKKDFPMMIAKISGPPRAVGSIQYSASQLAWEKFQQRAFVRSNSIRVGPLGCTSCKPRLSTSQVPKFLLPIGIDPVTMGLISSAMSSAGPQTSPQQAGSLSRQFGLQNGAAFDFVSGNMKSIPVIGPLLNKIFGPCGMFAGWDKISQAQLARVNAWRRYLGEAEITTEDEVCNWRLTIHQDRVAIENDVQMRALLAQFRQQFGAEKAALLVAQTRLLYEKYINKQDPIGSEGRHWDYATKILNDWQRQSNGERGSLTVEGMLQFWALNQTAKNIYGFEPIPQRPPDGPAPWETTQQEISRVVGKDLTNSSGQGSGGAGALLGGLALFSLLR